MSPDSIVPDPADPQTLNRYSYCRNNPVMYVDPSGHFFFVDDAILGSIILTQMVEGAIIGSAMGAAIGAGVSAATGGDVGQGALTGAISGAIFGAMGGYVHAANITGVTQAALHTGAGALSGTINAGVTGGDVGMGTLTGGISAGIAFGLGSQIPLTGNEVADFGIQLGSRAAIGGITGGTTAAMYGGDFGQGFEQGAMAGAYGYLFNCALEVTIAGAALLVATVAAVYSPAGEQMRQGIADTFHDLTKDLALFGRKRDLGEVDEAARRVGGLTGGQREILHRQLADEKIGRKTVPMKELEELARQVKKQFPNK